MHQRATRTFFLSTTNCSKRLHATEKAGLGGLARWDKSVLCERYLWRGKRQKCSSGDESARSGAPQLLHLITYSVYNFTLYEATEISLIV